MPKIMLIFIVFFKGDSFIIEATPFQATNETGIFKDIFFFIFFCPQVPKGVNNYTKNKIKNNNDDNNKKRKIINYSP